jgi:uncharacterized protein (DUF1778 family)
MTENKTENINLRVSTETKRLFEKMASARGMSLTEFILGLVSNGAALEKARRANLRAIVNEMV